MARRRKCCHHVIREVFKVIYFNGLKPSSFKRTYKNVSQGGTFHRCTSYLFQKFVVKREEFFFGGYVKKITKKMFRVFRGSLLELYKLLIQILLILMESSLINRNKYKQSLPLKLFDNCKVLPLNKASSYDKSNVDLIVVF